MDQTQRTAAVVLAYHPPPSVRESIQLLLTQVPRVFVVNNSPDSPLDELGDLVDDPRVSILNQSKNVGVAAGFNAGMRAALEQDFDYVWTFDQDSTVSDGMLRQLLNAYDSPLGDIGVVGPALRAAETQRIYEGDRGVGVARRDVLISSGALFPRTLLEHIGLHDESLFIDYVDHDICLRAVAAGFTNVKVFDAILDHRFGDSQPARFLGRRVYLSNYSPLRQYYMSRNRVILVKRFGMGPWFREDISYLFKAWTKVLFCETDRPLKIRAFFRGFRDGLRFPVPSRRRVASR